MVGSLTATEEPRSQYPDLEEGRHQKMPGTERNPVVSYRSLLHGRLELLGGGRDGT